MEGFNEEPADAGSSPFDAGFEEAPAAPFGAVPLAAEPASGGSFGGGAGVPLDDSAFGGADELAAEAPVSNGGAQEEAPAAVFAAPTFDDPRIAAGGGRQQQQRQQRQQRRQQQQQQQRVSSKKDVLAKAKAHLEKQAKEREALLSKRKSTNRELERSSNAAAGAVPTGEKPWERVLSVITFNREDAKGPHVAKDTFKELSRFKAVLLSAKAANVPIKQ
ncbi:hypothetical protein Rsub_04659 [Raphidocelis subcapitata]|uniref:Clathrin light chain n=1 Tax=Raphidocelis subcapitata TaxID=307507 RepID=A0A2V0P4C4_9CHLO|nr:hypothetical protein Rsub_04659 [Raphidocelis subcapitata]|eukprot:GBF91935.1 hypothetical protein Rsub_04659 [Raphidocelis subcapitata]